MNKTVIYLRTSTEEQSPQNQLNNCKQLANKMGIQDYEVYEEKQSAFKDNVKRAIFGGIIKAIENNKINNLICWDLDRLYRNRKKLLELFNICKAHKCKIYSVRQEFLSVFDTLNLPQGFEFLAEMYRNNFLQFLGWIAEEESKKKSDRVKLAVRKVDGMTKSYKGKKWGRKELKLDKEIIELYNKGKTMMEISKEVFYWDKNNHKKFVSIGAVHKIISEGRGK